MLLGRGAKVVYGEALISQGDRRGASRRFAVSEGGGCRCGDGGLGSNGFAGGGAGHGLIYMCNTAL